MTLTPDEMEARQLALEEDALGMGVTRYEKNRTYSGEALMPPGMFLLKRTVYPVAEAIKEWTTACQDGKARDYASIARFLDGIPAEIVAYLTAKQCLQAVEGMRSITNVAISLSSLLIEEINLRVFSRSGHVGYQQLKKIFKRNHTVAGRRKAIRAKMKFAGIDPVNWGLDIRLRMGRKLIDIFKTVTGLVEEYEVRLPAAKGFRDVTRLRGTEQTLTWLKEHHERNALLSPIYLPMIIPPLPWTSPFNGGYLSIKLKLIKSRDRNYLEELRWYDMPKVYEAINLLQSTPWKINRKVYDVLVTNWRTGGCLGNLPAQEDQPLPPTPLDINQSRESLIAWKRQAKLIHIANTRAWSKRMALNVQLSTAERFLDSPAIYFPHSMDWRGRLYPVPAILNPQGSDVAKGLLHFAEGKPLTESGARWLKIHTANLFGIDKVSMDERLAWVDAHQDEILDSADNPLDGGRFWDTADEPYQALAACFELAGYWREGPGFVSHLPVAMDGSCNGIQNFSAMLKDAEGGAAVNLVPSDRPQDIYQQVADVVAKQCVVDAAAGDFRAAVWVGNVTRQIVKRPVMTLPYGATEFGMRDQILEELIKQHEAGTCPIYNELCEYYAPSRYMAHTVYKAIGQVVRAAREAMDWLQAVAKLAAKDGLPIQWVTPAGLPVLQAYRVTVGKRVQCLIDGRRVVSTVHHTTTEIDTRKQSQGIAPNYVHSMDASHLMLTVCEAHTRGISSFSMVHDSYATHAADADTLAATLRNTFVQQYLENDVLAIFRAQLEAQLKPELAAQLPPIPASGNLDLQLVKSSVYFFA